MDRLERNTLANLGGTIWSVVVGLVCVPLFIRFLGAEAFGLVGVFLALQSVFSILDFGIAATLNREIARLSAMSADPRDERDLVFTLQALYWAAAAAIAIVVIASAPLIAAHWLKPHALAIATVTTCIRMMGVAVALQFPFVFYQAGMLGLQRHVVFNAISAIVATLRGPGILVLLAFVSPTPSMYFGGQIAVSVVATCASTLVLWRCLPAHADVPRFRREVLQRVWRFGASWSANSLANLALLQGDKIILSAVLPLATFGYYTLAQRFASGIYAVIVAVDGAIFPRFSAAVAADGEADVARVYHRGSQIMTVLVAPLAVVIAIFSREILTIWTRDPLAVANASLVLTLLAAGMLLHGFIQSPYYLQVAHGWWRLISIANAVLIVTILPLYVFAGRAFGANGAAAVWVVLNAGFAATVPLMHRRFLRRELRRWLVDDIVVPLAGAVIAGGAAHALMPPSLGSVPMLVYVAITGVVSVVGTAALAPHIRSFVVPFFRRAAAAEVV